MSVDYEKVVKMMELKDQAKALRDNIKRNQKTIDNPALTTGILNELDFFIENVEENQEKLSQRSDKMSDYFRVLKDGEKLPKVTADDIDKEYIEKEFDRYIKENLEIEREKYLKEKGLDE